VYGKAKELILNGDLDITNSDIRVLFVKSSYSPNRTVHEHVSDIGSSSISQRTTQLQNVTNNLGVIDADDFLSIVYNGQAFNAFVLYKNTGSDTTSKLIAYIDTSVGLPYSGSSEALPLSIVWDNGQNKIISIQ
jgi:hypothetical protein